MFVSMLLAAFAPMPVVDPGFFPALRAVDGRLAAIAWRLTIANAPLCDALAPTPGMAIHALGQYEPALRPQAKVAFGFAAPVAVESVVRGGAASRAGVAEDDGLVAINGQPLGAVPSPQASSDDRDAALALLARQNPDRPIELTVLRAGKQVTVTLPPSPGCRSKFEVLLGPKMEASSDGRVIQIGSRFFERYDDEQIAVVVAHELAHTILRHRERLDAAGVKRGLLAEVGRNGRLFRRTEQEADLLGVHLLRNAGYDPAIAGRFWREHGGDVDGGLFRSRTHPSSKARAAAIEAELAALPPAAPTPYVPPILATRDRPLG
jgi:hypothetical protein